MSSRTSNSKCTDFQTQDGIELESCLLSLSDKDKSFSGSLVLDLRIWKRAERLDIVDFFREIESDSQKWFYF